MVYIFTLIFLFFINNVCVQIKPLKSNPQLGCKNAKINNDKINKTKLLDSKENKTTGNKPSDKMPLDFSATGANEYP
jgi:hypothetical protein